jgi:hypothetical protein
MGFYAKDEPVHPAADWVVTGTLSRARKPWPENSWPPILTVGIGHRFYNPGLGRWVSRDPIERVGGIILNVFVGNNPHGVIDLLGLEHRQVSIFWINFDTGSGRRYDISYDVTKTCNGKDADVVVENIKGNLVGSIDSATMFVFGSDVVLDTSTKSTASDADCPHGQTGNKITVKLTFTVTERVGIKVGLGPIGWRIIMWPVAFHHAEAEESQSCCACDTSL